MSDDGSGGGAIGVVVALVIVLGGLFLVVQFQKYSRQERTEDKHAEMLRQTESVREPFKDLIEEVQTDTALRLGRSPDGDAGSLDSLPSIAGLAGPCIILDVSSEPQVWLPWCTWPDSMRASAPSDLATLIMLTVEPETVAQYSYTRGPAPGVLLSVPGIRLDYNVRVYDWPERKLLVQGRLYGSAPPGSIQIEQLDFAPEPAYGDSPPLQEWFRGSE